MKKTKILKSLLLVSIAALTFVACGKKQTTNKTTNNTSVVTTKTNSKTTKTNTKTTKTNTTTKNDVVMESSKVYRLNEGFIDVNVKEGKVDSIIVISTGRFGYSGILKPVFINDKIVAFDMYRIFVTDFENESLVYDQVPIGNLNRLYGDSIDMFYDGDDFVIRNAEYVSKCKGSGLGFPVEFKGINDIKVSNKGEISANITEIGKNDEDFKFTKDGFEFLVYDDDDTIKFVVDYEDDFNYVINEYLIKGENDRLLCTISSETQSNGDVLKKETREVTTIISPKSALLSSSTPIGIPISGITEIMEDKVLLDFEKGKVVNVNDYLPNGSINHQTKYTYNKDGLLASISGYHTYVGNYTTSYSYDKNYNLVRLVTEGEETTQYDYEYDSKHRLTKQKWMMGTTVDEDIYVYDSNSKITSVITNYYWNGELEMSLKRAITYKDGFISKVEDYYVDGDVDILNEVSEKDYNTDGTVKFDSEIKYDEEGSISSSSKKEYIYDSNKKCIGEKYYEFSNRWVLKTIETDIMINNQEFEHYETYKQDGNNDTLETEVDRIKTYDEETGIKYNDETVTKTYSGSTLVQTLKELVTYKTISNNKVTNIKNYILIDDQFVLYRCNEKVTDSNERILREYTTSFDMNTLAFESGSYIEYEYSESNTGTTITKYVYEYDSYEDDYSPSSFDFVKEVISQVDKDGNPTGTPVTRYYDEEDRLSKKELDFGDYIEYYDYYYDQDYILEVIRYDEEVNPTVIRNYYYQKLNNDNLLYSTRQVCQRESELDYKYIYETNFAKFDIKVGTKVGEDVTCTYENGVKVKEEQVEYRIESIEDGGNLSLKESLTITLFEYNDKGLESVVSVYKGSLDNLYEKYTYSYDSDDRIESYDYEWHSSGINYEGLAIYDYKGDESYTIDLVINKVGETKTFVEKVSYYTFDEDTNSYRLTKTVEIYETNSNETFYKTILGKTVPTDTYDEGISVNGKYLIKTTMSLRYDFYGNAVMDSQTIVQDQYENEVDLSDLENNTLLGSVERITYFYDKDNNKFTGRMSTKYDADGNMIKVTIIENTFSGTSSYDRIELVTNYGDDETVLSVEETKTKRDYESDGLLDGYYKTFTDYTTTPETVTTYYYEAGEWIPVM